MPAVSPDRFLDALRKSGLLAGDLLDAQLRRSAAEGPPEDASELAARFVRDGLLTPFQADQLLQGRWRNFIVGGKYKVLAPLGAGGMGQVFLAEHTLMRRRAALKFLPKKLTADPHAVERFLREARAVASLDHPNIVRAYDIDTDDDLHFLVMEFVDGVSLHQLVKRRGPVAPMAAANYIAQAAQGLQHAHEAGWVHRDIKPANLLLDRAGVVKVLDLGLARLLDDDTADPLTRRHNDKAVLGTADYLAPEQALDSHEVDIRADVYSLGGTLYYLLAGRAPFADATVAQKLVCHQTKAPRPIAELRSDVPAGLLAVLDRMLAKAPADRFQTPTEVAAALRPWGGSGPAYPPPADVLTTTSGGSPSGSRSGALSSWAKQPGQSASRLTPPPRSGRPSGGGSTAVPAAGGPRAGTPSVTTETAPEAVWADITKPIPARPAEPPPLPAGPRGRRRWPAVAGAVVGAVAVLAAAAVALRPRSAPPADSATAHVQPPASTPTPASAPGTTHTSLKPAEPAESADEVRRFVGHQGPVEAVAFTPDGRRLVTVGQDHTGRVWDVATGTELKRLEGHNSGVRGVAVLPDGRRAATAGVDKTLRLWDLDTGAELKKLSGHTAGLSAVAADRDGRRLLTAGMDHSVRLWDVDGRQELKKLDGHTDRVSGVAFLPDGRRAVSAGWDKTLRLWDLDTGKELRKVPLPEKDRVGRLSLSADGKWVLLGCGKTLRRWDPDGGVMRVTYVFGTGSVEAGVPLPDGRVLIAFSDGTVRLWDLDHDTELHTFPGHGPGAVAVAASPDGRHFATGGKDGSVRLWRVPEKK